MACNQVNILNYNHNLVEVTSGDNFLVITDKNACTTITIPQPVTNIIQVNTPGPQGPQGPSGSQGGGGGGSSPGGSDTMIQYNSGSVLAGSPNFIFDYNTNTVILTGSLTVSSSNTFTNIGPAIFSGSINVTDGITGSLLGTASWAENAITASYYQETDPIFTAVSGTLATTGSNTFYGLQTISSSTDLSALDIHVKDDILWTFRTYNDTYSPTLIGLASWIDNDGVSFLGTETDRPLHIYNNANYFNPTLLISSSGVTINNTLTVTDGVTGSFTGSFVGEFSGSGTNLSNIPASAIIGLNLSQIISGSVSASISPDNGLQVNTNITATSFTGSLYGTASWALNSITSSYAFTSSYSIFAETSSYSTQASDIIIQVINQSGAQINKGIVVRITGSNNASDTPRIGVADWTNDNLSANTLGLVLNNIANGSTGYVMTEGLFKGYDTSTPGWQNGQVLYLGANGSITGSAPHAPLHSVRLGQVTRVQSNNGAIFIRVDNGYELGELHDIVDNTTTSSFGDLLIRSGSVWINSKTLTGSYILSGSLATNDGVYVQTLTASFISASGGITGSLFGTASYALTASFALNVGGGGSGAGFPYSGSAVITGSLLISGSGLTVTGSTAISGILTVNGVGVSLIKERRQDFVYPFSYCGTAPSGSAEAVTVWTIVRINVSGSVDTIGTATNVAWTNRYSAIYI